MKTILWGICGIGGGHCQRQLPIIQHYLHQGYSVIIFTYGYGLEFFKDRLGDQVQIIAVDNPYYVGDLQGLNWAKTQAHPYNQKNFGLINHAAVTTLNQLNRTVDLVISDYEMVSAQYAYLHKIPLITLDQQSKFLIGDFPPLLNQTSYQDEIERLSLFFPWAQKRIALSFFKVPPKPNPQFTVEIVPPVISFAIDQQKIVPHQILVYLSSQQKSDIDITDWIKLLAQEPNFQFHVFLRSPPPRQLPENVQIYPYSQDQFIQIFEKSAAIISTAGHSLLSEALHFQKPVYAIPLDLYEQQLNAQKITAGNFGVTSATLTPALLREFLTQLNQYRTNIQTDTQILQRGSSSQVFKLIDELLK